MKHKKKCGLKYLNILTIVLMYKFEKDIVIFWIWILNNKHSVMKMISNYCNYLFNIKINGVKLLNM